MNDPTTEAAHSFCNDDLARLADAVIADLRLVPACCVFPDTHCRHFWDELSYYQQEGTWDDISEAIEDTLRPILDAHIQSLPKPLLALLSAHASEVAGEADPALGSTWPNGLAELVAAQIRQRAARRDLAALGPDAASELEGSGLVWDSLGKESRDIAAGHIADLLDPNADLSDLAHELAKAWLDCADSEARHSFFQDFFQRHWDRLTDLLVEDSILPELTGMRARLLMRLDTD